MKKLIPTLLLASLFAMNTYAQKIEFEASEIDYGKIQKDADGKREFKFTNTGDAPLIISAAKGSCGCTVPTYAKEPVMPGESSIIEVKYDTKRVGPFTKYVTLTTNATNETTTKLQIKGEVLAPAKIEIAQPKTSEK